MEWNLSREEMRALGSLVEKEAMTPDQYPLSINALTQACNQKSNRNPVMQLSEPDVRIAVNTLIQRGLARHARGYSARVSRFEHRFGTGGPGSPRLTAAQRALLCTLLLRGPQTPGELRSRAHRLADITDIATVETTLSSLENHDKGPLVTRLERESGKRESRYAHCFGKESDNPVSTASPAPDNNSPSLEARILTLEREMAELRTALRNLQS